MDHARRLWCGPTLVDRPGARLLWSRRQIRLQAERAEADARQLVQSRFVLPHGGEQLGRFALGHVHEFRFDLGVQEDRLRRRHERGEFGALCGGCEHRFVHVEDVDDRLRGQQAELLDQREIQTGGGERLTAIKRGNGGVDHGQHLRVHLLPLYFFLVTRTRLLERLQIRKDQLGVDGADVALRLHLSVHVDDVFVGEAAHHLRNGIRLTNVREELVAEPFARRCAAHDARDVNERNRRWQDLLRSEDLGKHIQARIRQVHHADVRFDRCKRIVGGEHVVLGERVEERALAHVRKTDNANGQCHDATPSASGRARRC